jgi:hypothetical protein
MDAERTADNKKSKARNFESPGLVFGDMDWTEHRTDANKFSRRRCL